MPQLEVQLFLDLAEKAEKLACWDLETSGLGADYQSIIIASIKPFNKPAVTFCADRYNKDKRLVRQVKAELEKYVILVAHFGKGFDIPFLNTRLLYWGLPSLEKRHHIDTFFQLKYRLKTSSASQAALLSFLELPEQKMSLPPGTWQSIFTNKDAKEKLIARCESDCKGLEALYKKTRHLFRDVVCQWA